MSKKVKIKFPTKTGGPDDFSGKTSKMIADKTHPNPLQQQQPAAHVRTIESAEIFRGQSEIVISA